MLLSMLLAVFLPLLQVTTIGEKTDDPKTCTRGQCSYGASYDSETNKTTWAKLCEDGSWAQGQDIGNTECTYCSQDCA